MVSLDYSGLANLRVVIAEDEEIIGQYIGRILSEAGAIIVAVARTVPEALELIERTRPNAVTLDGNLGGTLSSAVAKRLDELGIRYLIVSGAHLASDARLSAAPRLAKPFTPETLRAAVAQHLC
ncbi:MAG: response regulator [Hyphomicrobiales bacterium]|nr:MAG: response regulator [Hyphomicrobiales bacterium]